MLWILAAKLLANDKSRSKELGLRSGSLAAAGWCLFDEGESSLDDVVELRGVMELLL